MPSFPDHDFEAKVMLDATKVLDEKNKLTDDFKAALGITKGPKKMSIQFVDNAERVLHENGWNLRIRKAEDSDKGFELTYKKRYPVNTDKLGVNEEPISTAIAAAQSDGFEPTKTLEAQVEVGFKQQTLSLSMGANESDSEYEEMELPGPEASRQILVKSIPAKLRDWSAQDWGVNALNEPVIYGPVHAKRYTSKLNGLKVTVEVWPIQKSRTESNLEHIVEASFKSKTAQEAFEGQASLASFFQSKGWFLAQDSLKTKLIMDRYGKV